MCTLGLKLMYVNNLQITAYTSGQLLNYKDFFYVKGVGLGNRKIFP